MQNSGKSLIQAVEWKEGSPWSIGTFIGVGLIHCVTDGDVTAHFVAGDETRSFVAGDDFVLRNVDVTIVSGTFDIN